MHRDLIIPLPRNTQTPDFQGMSKRSIGFYPCITLDGSCREYRLVKIDAAGKPYSTCSKKEITSGGCGRRNNGIVEDIPDQTYTIYRETMQRLKPTWPIPIAVKEYLENTWQNSGEIPQSDTLDPATIGAIGEIPHASLKNDPVLTEPKPATLAVKGADNGDR